jgi:hypothetical protein
MLLQQGRISQADYSHAMDQGDSYSPEKPPIVSTHGVCKFTYEKANGQQETVILKAYDHGKELKNEIKVSEVFGEHIPVAGYIGSAIKMRDNEGKTLHFGIKDYDASGDQTSIDASQGSLDVFVNTVENVLVPAAMNSDAIRFGLGKKGIKIREAKDGNTLRRRFYDEIGNFSKDDKKAVTGFIDLIDTALAKYGESKFVSMGDVRDANVSVSGQMLDLEPRSSRYAGIDMELRSEAHDLTFYMVSLMTHADREFSSERREQIRTELVGAYQQRTGKNMDYLNEIVDLELIKNSVTKVGDHVQRALSGEDDVETRLTRAQKSLEIALETMDERIASGYEGSEQLEAMKSSVLNQIMSSQDERMKSLQDYVSGYLNPVQPLGQQGLEQVSPFVLYALPTIQRNQPLEYRMPIIFFNQNLAS